MAGRHYQVTGRVQGVGFRYFVSNTARRLGLSGWVRNLPDGSVECVADGEADDLERLERELRKGPPLARVAGVVTTPHAAPVEPGFDITR